MTGKGPEPGLLSAAPSPLHHSLFCRGHVFPHFCLLSSSDTWGPLDHPSFPTMLTYVSGEGSCLGTLPASCVYTKPMTRNNRFPLCHHACCHKPAHIKRGRSLASIRLVKLNFIERRNHRERGARDHLQTQRWRLFKRSGARCGDSHGYPRSS